MHRDTLFKIDLSVSIHKLMKVQMELQIHLNKHMLKYFGKLQYQEHVIDHVFNEYVSGYRSKRVTDFQLKGMELNC